MKKIFIFLLLFLLVFATGIYLWWQIGTGALDSASKTEKTFVIQNGESVKTISARLEKEGLIKNQLVFALLVRRLGLQGKMQAGEFKLSPSQTAQSIAQDLTHGTEDVWVTVPEGWRNEEIADRLFSQLNIPREEFLRNAKIGYMFPDTYLFPKSINGESVAKLMEENFQKKVKSIAPEILNPDNKIHGFTLEQTVIIASLVEREAKGLNDRPLVAGILIKRLQNDWPLEVDASLQYALGYDPIQKTWWRNDLTAQDLKLDSAYNSRKYKSLPPTAICNPGLAAIKAVLQPQESDYWFYISDKKGQMHYAKTLEDHNKNISKYLSQ